MFQYIVEQVLNKTKKIPFNLRYETIDFTPSIFVRKNKLIYAKKTVFPKNKIPYKEQYETTDIKK